MSLNANLKQNSLKRAAPITSEDASECKVLVTENGNVMQVKRRMYALLMMYSGWGYFGMQRSPTHPTIEGELTKALISCGYLADDKAETYRKVWFQRASKTDKSVSATGQVCSMLLPENEDIKTNMNTALPDHIRILDVIRVTRSFNAQTSCSHRIYDYYFPTFALAPHDLPGGNESQWNYRVSAERLTHANTVLKRFEGTHNFYNFTSGRAATDKSCYRYLISLTCLPPVLYGNHEYCVIRVIGQSFMLHQIRKMLGLMFAIVRGVTTESVFEIVFRPERVDVPKAPGLGLMLNQVVYSRYNERYSKDGIHAPIDWSNYEDEIAAFRMQYVYEHIDKVEVEERSMLSWLGSLDMHSYYFRPPDNPLETINPSGQDESGSSVDSSGLESGVFEIPSEVTSHT